MQQRALHQSVSSRALLSINSARLLTDTDKGQDEVDATLPCADGLDDVESKERDVKNSENDGGCYRMDLLVIRIVDGSRAHDEREVLQKGR